MESLKIKILPQQKNNPPARQPYSFFPGAFFAPQKTGLSAPIFFTACAVKKDFRCNPWREDRRRFRERETAGKPVTPKRKPPAAARLLKAYSLPEKNLGSQGGAGREFALANSPSAAGRAQGIAAESPQEALMRFRGLVAESPVFGASRQKCARIPKYTWVFEQALKRLRAYLLLAFCFLTAAALPAAESRALVKFLDESGIELSWEPYLETGRLSFGYQTVSFRLGEPWLLLDSEGKIPCEALQKNNGTLLIPETTEKVLRGIFFPPRPAGPRIGAIFIDPGHGGKDPGTIGRHTIDGKTVVINEKDIVLDTALFLGDMLKKGFPGRQVVFSRTTDTYLTLEERPEKAHAVKLGEDEAIVFVSIHANASLNPKAKGYEVWYLPPTYRRSLLSEADVDRDNREILHIMNDMLEEEFTLGSVFLARNILKGFDQTVGSLSENRGLKDESWFVVRKARMPSVLVEIGFVTNPGEAKLLYDRNHLKKIAQAIYSGIQTFIRQFEGGGVSGL